MRRKVLALLTTLALVGLLFTPAAFAKNSNAKESLVALGDSITFGYNLGVNNENPSKYAFPYLIENDGKDFRVNNLGVPGWRSDQLLDALKNNQQFRQAVIHADVITLDIGSNDLLQGLAANGTNIQLLQQTAAAMLTKLNENIVEIRSLTSAPIVVYNIYNPFQQNDDKHKLGDSLLLWINPQIQSIVDYYRNIGDKRIVLADAYSAFGDNQADFVRINDIHPTIAGQEILAYLAEEAWDQMKK